MSSKIVWKTELHVKDRQVLRLPEGAEPLHVAVQRDIPCIWWRVEPDRPEIDVPVYVHGTGHVVDSFAAQYVGSFMLRDGDLVFHVFTGPNRQ